MEDVSCERCLLFVDLSLVDLDIRFIHRDVLVVGSERSALKIKMT